MKQPQLEVQHLDSEIQVELDFGQEVLELGVGTPHNLIWTSGPMLKLG